jgi:hypothetical protein
MTGSRSVVWGGVLIAIGAVLLLDSLGTLELGGLLQTYWPLLLVAWGISILAQRRGPSARVQPGGGGSTGAREGHQEGDSLAMTRIAGDIHCRIASRSFRGGSATTVFGDVIVDCRDGQLADGEHAVRISSVFGDGTMIVPPGTAVKVATHTLFGDVEVFDRKSGGISTTMVYESPAFATAPRRLRIDIAQVFGDISVHEA